MISTISYLFLIGKTGIGSDITEIILTAKF